MRTVSAPAAAVLAGGVVPLALLIEMDLTAPLNLNTSNLNLVVSGTTYLGVGGIGSIAPLADTPVEVRGLTFSISGVPSDRIALALSEPVQGKAVRIKTAILDPSTYAVLDTRLRWAGLLDVMTINETGGTATINVSAENAAIDLARAATSLYSDPEQQRLNTGDLFLQFKADQVSQRIIWPSLEFFKK